MPMLLPQTATAPNNASASGPPPSTPPDSLSPPPGDLAERTVEVAGVDKPTGLRGLVQSALDSKYVCSFAGRLAPLNLPSFLSTSPYFSAGFGLMVRFLRPCDTGNELTSVCTGPRRRRASPAKIRRPRRNSRPAPPARLARDLVKRPVLPLGTPMDVGAISATGATGEEADEGD